MYEEFGARVNHENRTVQFRLFVPNQNGNTHDSELPGFKSVKVVGDFHKEHPVQWEKQVPDAMPFNKISYYQNDEHVGWVYESKVIPLEKGFYQYKYVVEFDDGETRWINDPCTRYHNNDGKYDNSGFVIGGTIRKADILKKRKPLKDLVIYELMIDNFTKGLMKDGESPIDVLLRDEVIDHFEKLGINAIEFMPWTAWPGGGFLWGYRPYLFFSVTDRYVAHVRDPKEKLSKLKKLIAKLHKKGIQVIMDGVFNHVMDDFPYYQLYRDREKSPYIGVFQQAAYFRDLDFRNDCTHQFILDVCKYWIDEFGIDGIRFDCTMGFYDESGAEVGLKRLTKDLRAYFDKGGSKYDNIALILEHIGGDARCAAADVQASGYWFDNFLWDMNRFIDSRYGHLDNPIMKILSSSVNWEYDHASHVLPLNYIENHDHRSLVNRISHPGDNRDMLWKTQPYMLALFTMPGSVMIHNGQEYGEDYWIPEDGPERIKERPLRWEYLNKDERGQNLFSFYQKLIRMRKDHPSLSTLYFHPADEKDWSDRFINGYGFDREKETVIYHRWGNGTDGRLERFMVVLNFSGNDQFVDVPFPVNGEWKDLLNDEVREIEDYWSWNEKINSNWGRIFYWSE